MKISQWMKMDRINFTSDPMSTVLRAVVWNIGNGSGGGGGLSFQEKLIIGNRLRNTVEKAA
ncbi:hypothetical protein T4B_7510 [Trichinella pseudospiralis]|uniref:Uncharacterized protein n=1 Tax=Trichinella pseudospiralis TaxID=6337 RepID=A0A0V1JIR8_TRIPS|nr:hypothetical protein T4A_12292 [Trichinella pseudospiralis]KRZ22103.1 hypothetical protein T4B_7510 [Trichinella pseudospiralis]KRZ34872.1 hypothetical protein T4C_2380 [Trichinella pseudospiralis]